MDGWRIGKRPELYGWVRGMAESHLAATVMEFVASLSQKGCF